MSVASVMPLAAMIASADTSKRAAISESVSPGSTMYVTSRGVSGEPPGDDGGLRLDGEGRGGGDRAVPVAVGAAGSSESPPQAPANTSAAAASIASGISGRMTVAWRCRNREMPRAYPSGRGGDKDGRERAAAAGYSASSASSTAAATRSIAARSSRETLSRSSLGRWISGSCRCAP